MEKEYLSSVLEVKNLSSGNFILRIEKKQIKFNAGQFFSVGIENLGINREYSVASSPSENYIDFFIREVKDGSLTSKLRKLKAGDKVKVLGPYGEFYLDTFDKNKEYIFIETGTGLEPFISIIDNFKI